MEELLSKLQDLESMYLDIYYKINNHWDKLEAECTTGKWGCCGDFTCYCGNSQHSMTEVMPDDVSFENIRNELKSLQEWIELYKEMQLT